MLIGDDVAENDGCRDEAVRTIQRNARIPLDRFAADSDFHRILLPSPTLSAADGVQFGTNGSLCAVKICPGRALPYRVSSDITRR